MSAELIADIVEAAKDLRDEDADRLTAELISTVKFDASLELKTRLQLAEVLISEYERDRAQTVLKDALALPLSSDQRAEVLITTVESFWAQAEEEELAVIAQLEAALRDIQSVDLKIRAHLTLSLQSGERAGERGRAEHNASAFALAANTKNAKLKRRAFLAHAESLFDAKDFARAEQIVRSLNPAEDDLNARAFLEDLARRTGRAPQPDASLFAERQQPPAEFPERFVQSFSYVSDELELLRTRLISPDLMRMWSHGAIKTPADLDSQRIFGPARSFACGCGRFLGPDYRDFVCHKCGVELISSVVRTVRPAHLTLKSRVVHPWFVPAIARVLDLTQAEVRAADAEELREELYGLHLPTLADELERNLQYASATRREKDVPRLATIQTIQEADLRTEWMVLELLPVWPPNAVLPRGIEREALRKCYAELLETDDEAPVVRKLFNLFRASS